MSGFLQPLNLDISTFICLIVSAILVFIFFNLFFYYFDMNKLKVCIENYLGSILIVEFIEFNFLINSSMIEGLLFSSPLTILVQFVLSSMLEFISSIKFFNLSLSDEPSLLLYHSFLLIFGLSNFSYLFLLLSNYIFYKYNIIQQLIFFEFLDLYKIRFLGSLPYIVLDFYNH